MAERRFRRDQRSAEHSRKKKIEDILGPDPDDPNPDPITVDMRQEMVMAGVTLTWLHYVFKRDRATAKALLRDCPVLRHGAGGAAIYDPSVAAQYLVKPKMDITKLIGTLKEADLPDDLKPKIWEARLKQQRWEEKAGQLWRADAVLEVFGETFKRLKETMQLWADDLGEVTTLTEKQRGIISDRVESLQADLHETLVVLASEKRTPSQLEERSDKRLSDEDESNEA